MINGREYDWESVTVHGPGGAMVTLSNVKYEDGREATPIYGKAAKPHSYGRGKYEASGSVTLLPEEFEALKSLLSANASGTVYDHHPIDVVVSYANVDNPTITDTLPLCLFEKISKEASEGDTSFPIELPFKILGVIKWNGVPAVRED